MRRVYGAMALLGLIIIVVTLGTNYVCSACDSFTRDIGQIEDLYKQGELEEANALAHTLLQRYECKRPILRLFVHRELMESIGSNIKGLPAFISTDSPEDLFYSSRILEAQFSTMKRLFLSAF